MPIFYTFSRQKINSLKILMFLIVLLIFASGCIAAESPKENNISKIGEFSEEKTNSSIDNISEETIPAQQPSRQQYTFIKKSPPQAVPRPLDDAMSFNISGEGGFSGLANQLEEIP